jgi:hypothetical protein
MTAAQAEIPVLSSIAEIGANYKVWLVDIWGVMHDGLRAHLRAVEATKAFREQAGIVVLLSNSPRPSREVQAQLVLRAGGHDATVTSAISPLRAKQAAPGCSLGPGRDRPIFRASLSLLKPSKPRSLFARPVRRRNRDARATTSPKDLARRSLPRFAPIPTAWSSAASS